jgi:cellulose synthase (UDP-forming)
MWVAKRRAKLALPVWLLAAGWFWFWWLSQAYKSNLFIYIPLSLALFYETTIMPSFLLSLTLQAKLPAKRRPPSNKKVAVITLCVPSQESMAIVEKQLKAMTKINYPHDNWILDEGNSQAIKKLAKNYGVKYFSRKGIKKYNQSNHPFEAKTKAGNVNAWLDYAKKFNYEFFVQLDIDHIPETYYLDKTLGHFRDKKVAWVQSPSVYSNLHNWTARASAEQEMGLHGPMQMGFYGANQLPLIVGSHAAYRTKAIVEIGGFQPTRAEDQLNSLVLASRGWRGVFVPEVLASGSGPETLQAYLTQQYAWARSIVQVLKLHSGKYLKKLSTKQASQFIFLQTWYPIASLTFLILYFAPVFALIFNLHIVSISSQVLISRIVPFLLAFIFILWSSKPLTQPKGLSLSWRGILLHLVRWPTILLGIISALTNQKRPYLVTPKGKFLNKVPTLKLYRNFLIFGSISALSTIVAVIINQQRLPKGQVVFALYDAMAMIGVCLIDIFIRFRQTRLKFKQIIVFWLKPLSAVTVAALLTGFGMAENFITPIQTSLALAPTSKIIQLPPNLNKMPIDALNDSQLDEQIAAKRYKLSPNSPVPSLGIYSPIVPVKSAKPYINSIFMDWRQNWMLAQGLVASNRAHATSMVTIEPKGDLNGEKLLSDIANGVYDRRLLRIINTIKLDPNTVYVRFAQEMDLPNSFNWGAQDPATYIAAYRHVVDLAIKDHVHNIKWIWSPAGLPSAALYYPGNKYVNIVGTTILYDPFWSGNYHPTFYQMQAVRAWLLSYHKPVWITEFGVGDENTVFQTQLIKSALAQYKQDGYQALVYMNIVDPNVKGPNYSLNNVSILDNVFSQRPFVNQSVPKTKLLKTKPIIHQQPHRQFNIHQLIIFTDKYLKITKTNSRKLNITTLTKHVSPAPKYSSKLYNYYSPIKQSRVINFLLKRLNPRCKNINH